MKKKKINKPCQYSYSLKVYYYVSAVGETNFWERQIYIEFKIWINLILLNEFTYTNDEWKIIYQKYWKSLIKRVRGFQVQVKYF